MGAVSLDLLAHVRAKMPEHRFCMVAGCVRFTDNAGAARVQAGEEHGRLDLCRGHLAGMVGGKRRARPGDCDGQPSAVAGCDLGAHEFERVGDPRHRPAAE